MALNFSIKCGEYITVWEPSGRTIIEVQEVGVRLTVLKVGNQEFYATPDHWVEVLPNCQVRMSDSFKKAPPHVTLQFHKPPGHPQLIKRGSFKEPALPFPFPQPHCN